MSRVAMVLNPKRIELRNGFCKEWFTSARASMQFHRFKPGLSHPQPGLNEVVSGTKGPPWLRPGLNFFCTVAQNAGHTLSWQVVWPKHLLTRWLDDAL